MTSAKKRFLEDRPAASWWREVVDHASFLKATDSAMLEMVAAMPEATGPADTAAAYYKLQGAREFLTHLVGIGDRTKPSPFVPPNDNLDHKA